MAVVVMAEVERVEADPVEAAATQVRQEEKDLLVENPSLAQPEVRPFKHRFNQIDAPARTVAFISEQEIGRAGRRAKSTMYTAPKNFVSLF